MKLRDPRMRLLLLAPAALVAAVSNYLLDKPHFTRWYGPDDPLSPGHYCQVEARPPGESLRAHAGCSGHKLAYARVILGREIDLIVPRNFDIENTTTMRARFGETRTVLLVAVGRESIALILFGASTTVSIFLSMTLWITLKALLVNKLRRFETPRKIIRWITRRRNRRKFKHFLFRRRLCN